MYSIKKVTMLLGCLALTCSIAFQASATEKFKVITTFTIIADMAKNVAGDAAEVSSITKPGAEIHEYQPTPGDIKRAQGAQLILANGMNLELWFQRFYQHLNGVPRAPRWPTAPHGCIHSVFPVVCPASDHHFVKLTRKIGIGDMFCR